MKNTTFFRETTVLLRGSSLSLDTPLIPRYGCCGEKTAEDDSKSVVKLNHRDKSGYKILL